MPAIDSVATPLVIRFANREERVVAACFPHPQGLLYLDLFWHLSSPGQAAHLISGTLRGDGPWKIGNCVVRLLGCHNTDPGLQDEFASWQTYLQNQADQYPPPAQIIEIAKNLGACPSTTPAA